MPKQDEKAAAERVARAKKFRKYAIIAGVLLAMICRSLPHEYQAPCQVLARLCTGGLLP